MSLLSFQHEHYLLEPGESVLDCLLRNGQAVSYSCKSGLCQACLVQAVDCQPTSRAMQGLKSTLQQTRHALACQWQPEADVSVRLPDDAAVSVHGSIHALQLLNPAVMKLVVRADDSKALAECRPGQYLNVVNPAGIMRSYSMANDCRADGCAEFHIAATAQGLFSNWLFNEAKIGDSVQLRGPAGNCFYLKETSQLQPMLLVGGGTGLAPLYGILNDALDQGHQGPISLLHAGSTAEQLYYRQELRSLAATYPNFSYTAVVREATADSSCQQGDAIQIALAQLAALPAADTRVYLCGNPAFVQTLRKLAFLKGVRSANIYCDPFIERSTASA